MIRLYPDNSNVAVAEKPKIRLYSDTQPQPEKPQVDFSQSLKFNLFDTSKVVPTTTGGSTTIQNAPEGEGKLLGNIASGAKSVITHPIETVGGVIKGAMDFVFNVARGTSSVVGAEKAADYVKRNQKAIDDIFNSNMKDESAATAGAVGQFVGQQIPYILGGEVLAPLAMSGAVGVLTEYGGGLSLKAVSQIGNLTKIAANVAGFIGLDQLQHTPEEGSRMDAVKRDLITLGVLEFGSAGLAKFGDIKARANIKNYLEQVKTEKPPLADLEVGVANLNKQVMDETGKTPQQLVGEIAKTEVPKIETPVTETKPVVAGEPKVEVKSTESVQVSRSQLPVGTGEVKVSRLEARIKERLDNLSETDKQNLSTYNEMNKKEQIKAAVDYVSKNPDEALQVLKGEKPAPKGLLNNSIFLAMEEQANTDKELAIKLASLRSTRAGQEISILTERDPHSPVKYMTDLANARIEALGGKDNLVSIRSQEIGKVKKAISINRLQKTDWNAFIDSISC